LTAYSIVLTDLIFWLLEIGPVQIKMPVQDFGRRRMPADGLCLWHAGAGVPQNVQRDSANRCIDPIQRAKETRAAVEAAEPFMRALDRWNKDNPEQGECSWTKLCIP